MSFTELGLIEPIARAITAAGYETPTEIQAAAIPAALEGRDVLGCAQTGTGKTCAFALPMLQRLAGDAAENRRGGGKTGGGNTGGGKNDGGKNNGGNKHGRRGGRAVRGLILCPTRELAAQIFDSLVAYGRFTGLRYTAVFGGVKQHAQVRDLRNGVDVVVATPGRLMDLIDQGRLSLRDVECLVLDEADRMLDMGFINDIRKIVAMMPGERQSLLFSATVSSPIATLAQTILRDPLRIETARESTTASAVSQRVYMVRREEKADRLGEVLRGDDVSRALVFTRTKRGADRLTKRLEQMSIDAVAIHGDKTQAARTKAMKSFKSGRSRVLVATDVASRGIDVDEISHVVNFDMPVDAETYVHRVGRTARAGATGVALSFCARDERGVLREIERRTKQRLNAATDHLEPHEHGPEDRGGAAERSYKKKGRPGRNSRAAAKAAKAGNAADRDGTRTDRTVERRRVKRDQPHRAAARDGSGMADRMQRAAESASRDAASRDAATAAAHHKKKSKKTARRRPEHQAEVAADGRVTGRRAALADTGRSPAAGAARPSKPSAGKRPAPQRGGKPRPGRSTSNRGGSGPAGRQAGRPGGRVGGRKAAVRG